MANVLSDAFTKAARLGKSSEKNASKNSSPAAGASPLLRRQAVHGIILDGTIWNLRESHRGAKGNVMITFEIRLKEDRPKSSLLFVTARSSDAEAVEQARRLLERHPEYETAEIWNGMKMVRQI
jgi:hypothetical protein